MDILLKMAIPIVEKQLQNKKVTPIIENFLSNFPLEKGEVKNAIICTVEKEGVTYLSVAGMGYNKTEKRYYINKIKQQKPIIEAIKELIGYAK